MNTNQINTSVKETQINQEFMNVSLQSKAETKYLLIKESVPISELKTICGAKEVKELISLPWKLVYNEYVHDDDQESMYVYEFSNDATSMILNIKYGTSIIKKFQCDFEVEDLVYNFFLLNFSFYNVEDKLELLAEYRERTGFYPQESRRFENIIENFLDLKSSMLSQRNQINHTIFNNMMSKNW